MQPPEEIETVTERVAEITWRLSQGERLTVIQVAREYGMTWDGAYKLLTRMSRKVPIYSDKGEWQVTK